MRTKALLFALMGSMIVWGIFFVKPVPAACRNPNLVLAPEFFIVPAAASSKFIEISWFGHAFFQFTTSSETRIVTDPFSEYIGYPVPEVWPHVVTVGRDSGNHNNVDLVKGDPRDKKREDDKKR